MATVHSPVDPRVSFPALEERVLERWRERDIFAQSIERRQGAPRWGFFEGPPTANGLPGSHHVLARVFKDIFPRYRTMCGYHVERKAGWDCHGLPVELAVERALGLKNKHEIEQYGIAEFNERCRASVFTNIDDWIKLTERIGYWIDTDNAYKTLDPTYVESVWWALKTIFEKGLLFEKLKVVPYCTRCGTALSSHELGQPDVYRDVVDRTLYVTLPVVADHGPVRKGDELVIWTTTPWTLPANVAVAAGPGIEYARARLDGRTFVVAAALVEQALGEGAEVLERFAGSELAGAHYEGPIFPMTDRQPGGSPVVAGDFVSTTEGTGLVHISPAFGQDDFNVAAANGLINPEDPHTVYQPVDRDGRFDQRLPGYEGRYVKDPEVSDELIEELKRMGKLLREQPYEHSYPHCWRCSTPLIYYAEPSWYIGTSQIKDKLLASNEAVNWHPEHVKHGRFGHWLEGNVDWALSRERYWGTPLPVWRCECDHVHVIGSLAELQKLSGVALEDPHRPYVDDVTFGCTAEGCTETMKRVPEVIDVWFDSGSMPFAQFHAPHSADGQAEFEASFPADYICEALDQTRGWFYSMLAVSTLLFDKSSYKNVVCLGLILDEQGRKMSKSLGNVVPPWEVLDEYGADAFRWYFFTSKYPWDGYRFSVETLGEVLRNFMLQLWNTYGFYVLYANAAGTGVEDFEGVADSDLNELDRWALSRLQATISTVRDGLDAFDATGAGRAIAEFVDELSNWYVRRSRRRFWDGEPAAFKTLHTVLVTLSKLLAPFTPFIADEIYENLDGSEPSVHLCDFPEVDTALRDVDLEDAMAVARETVRLGLAARGASKLKVRQPLHAAVVVADGAERAAIGRLSGIVRDELNVHELRFVDNADELAEFELKAAYRAMGPRFGSQMPMAAAAVAGLNPARTAATVRAGGTVGIDVGGTEHALSAEDLLITMKPLPGYQLEREGSHAVALELEIDDALRIEGWAREIVHAIQAARRAADFDISDRIALALGGADELLAAAREHEEYITGETLAVSVSYEELPHIEPVMIDGLELRIFVARV